MRATQLNNRIVVKTISRLFGEALLISAVCLVLTINASSQETLDREAVEKIERDAVFQLLNKDVNAVLDQLANEHPTTVASLFRHLIIYARTGRGERVRQTMEQLPRAADWQTQGYAVRDRLRYVIGAADLATWRLYYDHLFPRDSDAAEAFERLWDQQGDPKEFDVWLKKRSAGNSVNDAWFRLRVYRLAKTKSAGEVIDPLAAAVRTNPRDLDLAERYLIVNNWAGEPQDISWLADVCQLGTSYENYELGQWLLSRSPQAAARLLKKALVLPFTEHDAQLVQERGFRYSSVGPPRVNWEKQLRFWTRRSLAEAYQALKRPQDAQPLIEEVVAMKGDDIVTQDVHELAGAVQAASGQRVVEARVLRDEGAQSDTARYWIERASYYRGREEYDLELDSYRKGLTALPFDPRKPKVTAERLEIVKSFAFSLWERRNERQDWSTEIEKLLRQEFATAAPETDYAFQIARLITKDDFELEDLRGSLFGEQPDLLARLLARRVIWDHSEQFLIGRALSGDKIAPAQKEKIWTSLEKLIGDPGSARAYYLGEAMRYVGASERATPLLLGYLKNGTPNDYINKSVILSELVEAYYRRGDWQAAEKLLFSNTDSLWRSMPSHLGMIAATAGKQGAISDALRLWRLKTNLDRQELTGLDELARTEARSQLRAFYLQMKKDDPLSTAAERALQALR